MSLIRVKQKPQPFTGLKHTEEWKKRMSKMNKGKYLKKIVKIGMLHDRMIAKIPKPNFCQYCNKKPPRDLANISQKYKEDISDWEWLCRGCHMRKDGRIKNLISFNKYYKCMQKGISK